MSFDPKCLELAEYFTCEEPQKLFTGECVRILAQVIQDAIENYMGEVEQDAKAALEYEHDTWVDRAIDEKQLGEDI